MTRPIPRYVPIDDGLLPHADIDPNSPIPVVRKPRASVPWKTQPRKRGSRVSTRLDGAAYWQHHLAKRAAEADAEAALAADIAADDALIAETLASVTGIAARVDALLGQSGSGLAR